MPDASTKRPTMVDVARLADVSKATVSAVINGAETVSEATRVRVLEAITRLNYRAAPGTSGQAAVNGPRSLGLVVKEVDNPYYAEIVMGARRVAEARGYTLLVASSEGDFETERRAVTLLRMKGVEGLMVTPVLHEGADLAHLFDLKRRNVPFVLLEQVLGIQATLVDVENVEASRRATEYLIARGHTRLAHFMGPAYSMHSQERADGARWACSASHIVFTDEHMVPAGAHLADGYRAGLAYFGGRPPETRATGVTCYNDLVAIGLYRALAELGLRVPDDVSVVGFDDILLAEYVSVPLTTVRMPKARMGSLAAQMLIEHVEAQDVLPPRRVTLPSEIVERASVRTLGR